MAEFTQLKAKASTVAQPSSSGILPRKYQRGGFESDNNADQDSASRDNILPATVGHDFGKVPILSDQRTSLSDSQQQPAALSREQLNYPTVNALSFTYASPGRSYDFGPPRPHADASTEGAGEEEVNGATSEVEPESEPVSAEEASGSSPAAPEQSKTVVEQHQQRFTAFIKRAARPQESALGEEEANAEPGEAPRPGQTLRLPDFVISPQSASEYADAIAATFSYKSSITKAGATPPAGDFGITRPLFQMKMSGSQDAAGFHLTCDVDGQITFQLTSMGRTDIASDSDADINQGNYPKVVSDLTPNMNDLNGRPPRTKFWAEDLTEKHERKHAGEDVTFGQAGTTLADKWLNRQTAATIDEVKAKVAQALEIVKQKVDNEMKPPDSEKRAYGDGAPSYKARADAIKAKGDTNKYSAATQPKGTAPAAPAPKAPAAPPAQKDSAVTATTPDAPKASGLLQRSCACGKSAGLTGQCEDCDREKLMQRRATTSAPGTAPPIVDAVLHSPGQPLDVQTRAFMEPYFGHDFVASQTAGFAPQAASAGLTVGPAGDRFEQEADQMAERVSKVKGQGARNQPRAGYDFSHVRVHTDEQAAQAASSVGALAFTVGQNIVFGSSQYAPATLSGRTLLAHELTHVIQQGKDVRRATLQRSVGGFLRNIFINVPVFGFLLHFSDEALQGYLKKLDETGKIEDDDDSDNKAEAIAKSANTGARKFTLTSRRKALLILEMLSGWVSDDEQVAILGLLEHADNPELEYIFGEGQVKHEKILSELSGIKENLYRFYRRRFQSGYPELTTEELLRGNVPATKPDLTKLKDAKPEGFIVQLGDKPPESTNAYYSAVKNKETRRRTELVTREEADSWVNEVYGDLLPQDKKKQKGETKGFVTKNVRLTTETGGRDDVFLSFVSNCFQFELDKLTSKQRQDPAEKRKAQDRCEVEERSVAGFFDAASNEMIVRTDRESPSTRLHEVIHAYADKNVGLKLTRYAMEGLTEYLTRQIIYRHKLAKDEKRLAISQSYGGPHDAIVELSLIVGDAALAKAHFQGNVEGLAQTVGQDLFDQWLVLMKDSDGWQEAVKLLRKGKTTPKQKAQKKAASHGDSDGQRAALTPQWARPEVALGPTGDRFEKEADEIAERVMRFPAHEPEANPRGLIQERQLSISRRSEHEAGGETTAGPQSEMDALMSSGGSPLPSTVRAFFEPRFGHDFGGVRVHTDTRAAASARDAGAVAYTLGSHIVFDAGRFAPEIDQGQRLLAHELTHVVQQRSHQLVIQRQPRPPANLLTVPAAASAVADVNALYDEDSIRTLKSFISRPVNGVFDADDAEAVARRQQGLRLTPNGRADIPLLEAMLRNVGPTVAARSALIHLVINHAHLDVSGSLAVVYEPGLSTASDIDPFPGGVSTIQIGNPGFASYRVMVAEIRTQLAVTPAASAVTTVPPAVLTDTTKQQQALTLSSKRLKDPRSIKLLQGTLSSNVTGQWDVELVRHVAGKQQADGLTPNGILDQATLAAVGAQMISEGSHDPLLQLIVDYYDLDRSHTFNIIFDATQPPAHPTAEAETVSVGGPGTPGVVRVYPAGFAQPFEGLVHTVAHELGHIQQTVQGISHLELREFLSEGIEIESKGMRMESIESDADIDLMIAGQPPVHAGFIQDAQRWLAMWNALTPDEQRAQHSRFNQIRRIIVNRIVIEGSASQQQKLAPFVIRLNDADAGVP